MSRYPLVPLGEVLTPSHDLVPVEPTEEYPIAGIFSFGKGVFARERILGAETSYKKLTPLHTNQLVFGRLNAWEGGIAVVNADSQGLFVSQEFPVLEINRERADPAYVAHLCRWPDLWEALMARSRGLGARSGARRLRVHEERLLEVEVPLPDVEEQQRVAARLDAVTARSRAISQRVARAEKLADVLPASLAQRHDLSESEKADKRWWRRPLGSVMVETADFVAVDPTQSYPNVGVLSFGRGLFEKVPIDGSRTSATKLNRIRADQFVYSRLFAFEGAYAAVPSRFDGYFVSGEFPTFAVDPAELLAPFLAAYLKSEQTCSELAGASKGLGVRRQRIHVESLLQYEVWLPPVEQQLFVVRKLDRLNEAGRLRERSGARVSALQASTLNHAFAGLL